MSNPCHSINVMEFHLQVVLQRHDKFNWNTNEALANVYLPRLVFCMLRPVINSRTICHLFLLCMHPNSFWLSLLGAVN